MASKGPQAFRTISEAAAEVGVAAHVLRFWETQFSFIKPLKRAGGRRFYRPDDIHLLRRLRGLLHDEGRSIKEIQALPKAQWRRATINAPPGGSAPDSMAILHRAIAAQATLDRLLARSAT